MKAIAKLKSELRYNKSGILVVTADIFYISFIFLPFPATDIILYVSNT